MEAINKVKYQGYKHITNFIGKSQAPLKDSKFLEKGQLTPEEYMMAGEHLCHKCNTWSWQTATSKDLFSKHLAEDKQYLVTKGVPCEKRVKELQKFHEENADDLEKDAGDGWVETTNPESKAQEAGDDVVDIDDDGEAKPMQVISGGAKQAPAEEEVFDIDDSDDENVFAQPAAQAEEQKNPADQSKVGGAAPLIVKVRKYDLSITYDFYTCTPRLWLTGFNENGQPLTQAEIFEDIAADYAQKTVTMENHPHTGIKQASIHPCNHAKVMKTLNDTIIANGGEPSVDQCMFVFLKFIGSVIPTIQYDFTVDLELE